MTLTTSILTLLITSICFQASVHADLLTVILEGQLGSNDSVGGIDVGNLRN